jgi:hypothetical protein
LAWADGVLVLVRAVDVAPADGAVRLTAALGCGLLPVAVGLGRALELVAVGLVAVGLGRNVADG